MVGRKKNRQRKKRKESGPEQWDKRADDYADMVRGTIMIMDGRWWGRLCFK